MNRPEGGRFDVAIVGAGPAGMMAAIAARQAGASVALCEQLDRPGVKLLATGGGRCNATNTATAEAMMAAFGRQGRFMAPALEALSSRALREFLEQLGVPTSCPDGFHVYPSSNSAQDVQHALWKRCEALGVRIILKARLKGIEIDTDGDGKRVATSEGILRAPAVILCTGGRSHPRLGATGEGLEIAAALGHTIVPTTPALAPLTTSETWPARCAGVSLGPVRMWIDLPGQVKAGWRGDLLLTHTGVSGPAVLDASAQVATLLGRHKKVPVAVDLTPGVALGQWRTRLDQWGHSEGAKMLRSLLAGHLPAALARQLCLLAGLEADARAAHVPRAARDRLALLIKALPLTVVGVEGFGRAMVTRGGVSLREVNPRTLESKKVPGLFFAGEILDLDGPSGGYNLQWAFSSGYLAGSRKPEAGSR